MRPQQKNRQRGRNAGGGQHQNRGRNQNPLSRSYESNGPDLKVRGNAQQVADKYTQLARDATSAGDRVMAENYLQHAEHYNRIILTAQSEQVDYQRRRDEQAQARGDRDERQRDDRQRGRDDRRDRDERGRDDRREAARGDADGDEQTGRRRRRRDRDENQRDDAKPRGEARGDDRGEARGGRMDAAEAPQPEIGDLPIARPDEEAERKPRRGRRTKPAPVEAAEVDGGATTGDSDAAGEAPLGAEDGLARTVTRTRRRKAPIKTDAPEPAASDAAE